MKPSLNTIQDMGKPEKVMGRFRLIRNFPRNLLIRKNRKLRDQRRSWRGWRRSKRNGKRRSDRKSAKTRISKDGTWADNNKKAHFWHKLHTLLTVEHVIITNYAVTMLSVHDSQIDLSIPGIANYKDKGVFWSWIKGHRWNHGWIHDELQAACGKH